MGFTSLEICSGAGGQARGLELAGFNHLALVEIEAPACATLKLNRPSWNIVEKDVRDFSGLSLKGVDLLAGGVPCPPFSRAGKQLGANDDRDLFPEAVRLVDETRPRVVLLENVRGLLDGAFDSYRQNIESQLKSLGYQCAWKLIQASDFGVPQLRPRAIFIAIQNNIANHFSWPIAHSKPPLSVGQTLLDLMNENGWRGAQEWAIRANLIAPTLVGGSKKHGGPDLGPTRAKKAWENLGIDGMGIANEAPTPDFIGMPRLTVRMAARIQGFEDSWKIFGKKTAAYRQVGNAFPMPVAMAVGRSLANALELSSSRRLKKAA